jgi:predicted nuclease with RNAse H fold
MKTLGIDLAANPRKTGACLIAWNDGKARVESLEPVCEDSLLLELAREADKVAIDAPFGWPVEFTDALVAHRRGELWPGAHRTAPEEQSAFRARLAYRETDRAVVEYLGRLYPRGNHPRPLSVSTDRIGITAMRCAQLLDRMAPGAPVDRTGTGKVVEVYPAAALSIWGLASSRYKGMAGRNALGRLAESILAAYRFETTASQRTLLAMRDDCFDALVASLVARLAARDLTVAPDPSERALAATEGWIHLPVPGSLGALDGELRLWVDDDLIDRRAPDGWVQVTTAAHTARLLDTRRVVELSLDGAGDPAVREEGVRD